MSAPLGQIKQVQSHVVAGVEAEEYAPLLGSVGQLLGVGESSPAGLAHGQDIVAMLAQGRRDALVNVFVNVQADTADRLCHRVILLTSALPARHP
jgi:hypothetical protein